MKAVKTKLHQHRKTSKTSRPTESMLSAECWELDHDHPDPDQQLYRTARSPKQENL